VKASSETDRCSSRVLVSLVYVTLLGVGLRVLNIAQESAWLDEVLSLQCLNAPSLAAFLEADRAVDSSLMMPVYFTLEYAWARLTGGSILAMRVLSLIFGVLMLPMTFILGRRLFAPWAGVLATACLALSLIHIFFAQEIRMYSLLCLLTLMSFHTFWESTRRPGWGTLAANILVNALLLWTHLMAGLLFIPQGLYWLLFHRKDMRRMVAWGGAHATIVLSGMVWITANGIPNEASWMTPATWRELVNTFVIFVGGRASNTNPAPYLPGGVNLDLVLAGCFVVLIAHLVYRAAICPRTPEPDRRKAVTLLILWLVIPPLVLLAVSTFWRTCYLYRYVICSSLAVPILVGGAIATLDARWAKRTACVVIGALFCYQLLVLGTPFRPDYRAAAQHIQREGEPDDPLFIFKKLNVVPFEYQCELPGKYIVAVERFEQLCGSIGEQVEQADSVWVMMWRWDAMQTFEEQVTVAGYTFDLKAFGGMPPLYIYRISQE